MPIAVPGRCTLSPPSGCPGATVSRLVPSALSRRSSSFVDDAEMPTTPTIAAMPMAMPSADRNTRVGRDRRP